jgi:hypothetical protein
MTRAAPGSPGLHNRLAAKGHIVASTLRRAFMIVLLR